MISAVVILVFTFVSTLHCQPSETLPSLPRCEQSELDFASIEIPYALMFSGKTTLFGLADQRLSCPSVLENVVFPVPTATEETESDIRFEADGVLKYGVGHYWKSEYCMQKLNATDIVLSICEVSCEDPSGDKICVPKCCPWGKVLHFVNETNVTCRLPQQPMTPWSPALYSTKNISHCLEERNKSEGCIHTILEEEIYHYENVFSDCEDPDFKLDRIAYDDTPFAFTRDGMLRVKNYNWTNSEFCIDGLFDEHSKVSHRKHSHAAMVCICANEDPYAEMRQDIDIVYVVVMFISAFFLTLTVITYILIWDKQNIHGWTVFSLSVSMGLMLLFLGSARLIAMTQGRESVTGSGSCVFVGLVAHFLFLSTFSLLTCLSFDLWWTFRTLAPSIGRSKGILRFRYYLLFSLGLPLLIVFIGFMLDKAYGHIPKDIRGVIIPEYGIDTCYIGDKVSQGVFIFLPVALLLLANLLFFLTTMWIMYKYHQNTKAARKNSVKQKQTLYLFTKLFIVMGVTWTVEVIEYLSDYSRPDKDAKGCIIFHEPGFKWMVTDLFNILQGILIFIIFVCKKSVMVHLSRSGSTMKAIVSPVFRLKCCAINQLDLEAPSGKTNQSSVSMRTFTPRNQEFSSSD